MDVQIRCECEEWVGEVTGDTKEIEGNGLVKCDGCGSSYAVTVTQITSGTLK